MKKILEDYFGIKRVIIVPGDLDDKQDVLSLLSYALNDCLESDFKTRIIKTITILGGTTLSGIMTYMKPIKHEGDVTVVSGRGGMGDIVKAQANAVSEVMAERVAGKHVSLYVPENISQSTYNNLLLEPSVNKILKLIASSDIAIHSIGSAMLMAKERGMDEDEIQLLKSKKAVAEVFGSFYNQEGDIVYQIPRIGLQASMLGNIANVYAIAGGSSKASAIAAYLKNAPKQTCFITDEGAADLVLKGLSL